MPMTDQQPPQEPLHVFADDSTTPTIRLGADQLTALSKFIGDRDAEIGLLDAGDGYVKVTLYGSDGEQIDQKLLMAHYGDDL